MRRWGVVLCRGVSSCVALPVSRVACAPASQSLLLEWLPGLGPARFSSCRYSRGRCGPQPALVPTARCWSVSWDAVRHGFPFTVAGVTAEIPSAAVRNDGWDSMRGAADTASGQAQVPGRRYTSGCRNSESHCFPATVTAVAGVVPFPPRFPPLVA